MRFFLLVLVVLGSGCVRRALLVDPQELKDEVPRGKISVNFVSDDHRIWTVYAGDVPLCRTPCVEEIDSTQSISMRLRKGDSLYLHDLGLKAMEARRAMVVAEGTSRGEKVNGIVFTTLGGMGMVVGIVLTSVGCSDYERRPGTCMAGAIVGGVSTALTAFAISLLVHSLPKAWVLPVLPNNGT